MDLRNGAVERVTNMGSRGKSVEGGGSLVPSTTTEDYGGETSDVELKETPMSREDRDQVEGDWSKAYFGTGNSFKINGALVALAEAGITDPTDEELAAELRNQHVSGENVYETIKTIRTMDKIMRPLSGDINVTRFAKDGMLKRILTANGINMEIPSMADSGSNIKNFVDTIRDKIVGTNVFENKYLSTTYDVSTAFFKSRPIKLEILAPKGTMGVFSPVDDEAELAFSRKAGYTINDVSYDEHSRQIVLHVKMI